MFQAKHLMSTDLVTIAPDDSVDQAIALLVERGVTGLPVVDAAGNLVGVISEFDLLDLVLEIQGEEKTVSKYMSNDVCSVSEDTGWVEITDMFRSLRLRSLPVTRDGKLVGLLTRHDMIRAVQQARSRVRGELASEEERTTVLQEQSRQFRGEGLARR